MHDLNHLIPARSGWQLSWQVGMSSRGQIAATNLRNGFGRALLLTNIFRAYVPQPMNPDGSSIFSANRGVIPVKFGVTKHGTRASCSLPATISGKQSHAPNPRSCS